MRVNVYSEELTKRIQIVEKDTNAGRLTGIRIFLELPVTTQTGTGHLIHKGPFKPNPSDDDSSAVTIWGTPSQLHDVLATAISELIMSQTVVVKS